MSKVEPSASSPDQAISRFLGRAERPVDSQDEDVMAFADVVMRTQGYLLARRNPWLLPFDLRFETRDEVVSYGKEHGVSPIVRQDRSGRAALGQGRPVAPP